MRRPRLGAAVGLAVTVLLLAWVLRDVSPAGVWSEVRRAHAGWLLAAVCLATFSFVLRAARWGVLLEPVHAGTRFGARFGSVCIGFAVNNLMPARLGEITRAYALTRREPVPLGASIASLVVERVLDGVVLAFFLFGTISLPDFPLGEGTAADIVRRTANVGAVAFGAGLVALWALGRDPERAAELLGRTLLRVVPDRFREGAQRGTGTFLAGLGALSRPGLFARALAWSLAVWLDLSASIWAGLVAFDILAPGPGGAVFLQSVMAFAVAAPSSPGFFGVFEAAARLGLGLWDVEAVRIVSFATSYHILTFIPVTVLGLWFLRRLGLSFGEIGRSGPAPAGEPGA
ncbi:MAG: lysylphosphatidylglycerol synthase transmembrane domain-containing protein [Gemmatimonadota bacterium]|nr:lysylphosphatidylglycerol synthase transmembrane domain-containing protein [Gemmatimonadota bacterium]